MRGQPLTGERPLVVTRLSIDRLRRLLPLAISLGCLGLLASLFWGRLPAVVQVIQGVSWPALGFAAVLYLASLYVLAARIRLVFRVFDIEQSSVRYFLYTLIGLFFGNFLPTAMGGDVLKASYAAGSTDRLAEAFVATFVDRGLGVLGIIVMGSAALALHPGLQNEGAAIWLAPAVILAFAAVVAVCHVQRWTARGIDWLERFPLAGRLQLGRLARAGVALMQAPRMLLATFGLTLVSQVIASACLWMTARAVHLELSYLVFLVVLPAITVASMVPSINGMGVREAALVALLHGLAPEEQSLALALIFYGLVLMCSGLGGLVFLLRRPLGLRLSPQLVARFNRGR